MVDVRGWCFLHRDCYPSSLKVENCGDLKMVEEKYLEKKENNNWFEDVWIFVIELDFGVGWCLKYEFLCICGWYGGGKGLLMGPHLKDLKGARKHHTHTQVVVPKVFHWILEPWFMWTSQEFCNHRTTSALAELLRRQHQTSLVRLLHKKNWTDLMESSKPIEWVKHSIGWLFGCVELFQDYFGAYS